MQLHCHNRCRIGLCENPFPFDTPVLKKPCSVGVVPISFAARSASDIASIIVRMRLDKDFMSVVETLYQMDSAKVNAVKEILNAFQK